MNFLEGFINFFSGFFQPIKNEEEDEVCKRILHSLKH